MAVTVGQTVCQFYGYWSKICDLKAKIDLNIYFGCKQKHYFKAQQKQLNLHHFSTQHDSDLKV